MDQLALIGVSHRRGGAKALECWQAHFNAEALSKLPSLGFSEYIPIITCNRWDLALALPSDLSLEEARKRLTPPEQNARPYAYVGDAAFEQITRIAASLDSLNPGEDQIMSQVREAFRQAQTRGSTGKLSNFAFDTALRIAKKVRRDVALAPMNTSLFSLARPTLEQTLSPTREYPARVAVIGAGEMGTLAAKTLAGLAHVKVTVVNRRLERARVLATHLGGESMSLTSFLSNPPALDALVCATPVKDLIDDSLLARLNMLKIMVDLGIPRNVNHDAAERYDIPVLDVDSLQHAGQERRDLLVQQLAEAEKIVQLELDAALTQWTERQLGLSIQKLRQLYLDTIREQLPEDDATRLAHKFAHVPMKGLRSVAKEHGFEAAKTFLKAAGLSDN